MSPFLSFAKITLGLVATAAAIVGWSIVILQDTWLDELENRLAKADPEAAVTERGRSQVPMSQATIPNPSLGERQTELEAGQAALTMLKTKIDAAETELAQLQTAIQHQQRLQASAAPYQTRTRARVRAGPSTNTNEVAVVSAKQMLEVDETVEGGTWYKVRVSGYMFHRLVQPISED